MSRWKYLITVVVLLVAGTLVFAAPLKIDMGPTLGDLTPNSALLTWHTNEPATGWLEIAGQKIGAGELVHTHRVRVRGLEPGQTYWYTVKAAAGDQSDSIGPHRLKTPPASLTAWTFTAYGDTRSRPAHHRRVVAAMLAVSPRLILHTGDLVGDGRLLDHWQHFFPVIGIFSQNLPFYPCIGNHENSSPRYYELLPLPSGGGDGGSEWYSFRFGNCQFYALDSGRHIGEQTEWLRSQLAQPRPAGVDWRIVIFHHPPFSSGGHGSNQTLQEQWCPLLEDNGVDLVFCGHDHIYEHSLHGGVHYLTLGTGGAPLYQPGVNPNPHSQFAISSLGFSRVEVTREQLTVTFFDDGLQMLEQFTVAH